MVKPGLLSVNSRVAVLFSEQKQYLFFTGYLLVFTALLFDLPCPFLIFSALSAVKKNRNLRYKKQLALEQIQVVIHRSGQVLVEFLFGLPVQLVFQT